MVSNKLSVSEKSKILQLIDNLCSENGVERQNARKKLVIMGYEVLDYLSDMLSSPKHIHRWEALKVMEEIGDPVSIPVFLEFLEDEKSDLRWIAAQGLIRIGQKAIGPLLNLVEKKYDSTFVLDGAHHFFYDLGEKGLLPQGFPNDELLLDLKSSGKSERLKLLVYQIINDYKF